MLSHTDIKHFYSIIYNILNAANIDVVVNALMKLVNIWTDIKSPYTTLICSVIIYTNFARRGLHVWFITSIKPGKQFTCTFVFSITILEHVFSILYTIFETTICCFSSFTNICSHKIIKTQLSGTVWVSTIYRM